MLFNEQNLKKEKSQKIFIQQKICKFFTTSIGKWTSIENEYTKDNVACFFEIYCFLWELIFSQMIIEFYFYKCIDNFFFFAGG